MTNARFYLVIAVAYLAGAVINAFARNWALVLLSFSAALLCLKVYALLTVQSDTESHTPIVGRSLACRCPKCTGDQR